MTSYVEWTKNEMDANAASYRVNPEARPQVFSTWLAVANEASGAPFDRPRARAVDLLEVQALLQQA
jgi:hypothetical protein